MKIQLTKCLAIVIAMLAGSSAFGQNYYELCDSDVDTVSFLGGGDCCQKDCDDGCGKGVLDGLGCCGGGLWAEAELLFFKPDLGIESFGTAVPGPVPPTFNYEGAPRIAIGYVGCEGLGVRFRYFDFAHDTGGGPLAVGTLIDTFTMDAELFEELEIGCATTLEWSVGVRYIDFQARRVDEIMMVQQRQFSGWGLNFGLKFERCVGPGNVYGRARWSIQEDEDSSATFSPTPTAPPAARVDIYDDKIMQTEIAIGYEVSRCTNFGVVTGRIGYEIQYWEGLESPGLAVPVLDGFDGLVLGVELAR